VIFRSVPFVSTGLVLSLSLSCAIEFCMPTDCFLYHERDAAEGLRFLPACPVCDLVSRSSSASRAQGSYRPASRPSRLVSFSRPGLGFPVGPGDWVSTPVINLRVQALPFVCVLGPAWNFSRAANRSSQLCLC
jgi:hypothetical protein